MILASVLENYDGVLSIEIASGVLWTTELRLLLTDPEDDNIASRSLVFSSGENEYLYEGIRLVCQAAMQWLEEGNNPLPPIENNADNADNGDKER